MRYCNTLIAVKDMEKSLQFYKNLFEQEVTVDLGWCKSLSCGLTLQEHFHKVAGFSLDSMKFHSNTMELYFETEKFDDFITLLDRYPEVERLHNAKTFPWLQRGIHIFDPDGHLIEVSESMYSVACKQFKEGNSVEDTSKLIQHPLEMVQDWYELYIKSVKSNLSVCGTNCSTCYCYGNMCEGCNQCKGKVFHVADGKSCGIYDCVKNKKGLQNCGNCKEVPCDIWMKTRDPKFSDEEFKENVKNRVDALKCKTNNKNPKN